MFQDISVEELMDSSGKKTFTLIDVRSESEYMESTIPGSLNIPLFNDDERAEIGTIYKKISPEAAKQRGLEIVSAKLPAFIKQFSEIEGHKAVYCWRGGMRSKTTATVLSLMDIHVVRLSGGIRAYRNWVLERLQHYELKGSAVVINGKTGTGKTAILQSMQNHGLPVLDLEGLAGHRGSIFGGIGMSSHNQKTFDSLVIQRLDQISESPYFVMEGESHRIGKVVLPPFIVAKKDTGTHIMLELPIEERVRNILQDYQPWAYKEEILGAFARIKSRIHTPIAAEIENALRTDQHEAAVRLLLEHYYDPRYEHSLEQYEHAEQIIHVKAIHTDDADAKIRSILADLTKY